MKRVFVLGLALVVMVGVSGCGKKSKEKAMNDALQQAASGVEGTTEQGNFVIYEGDTTNAVAPAGTVSGAQTPGTEQMAAVPTEAPAAIGEKPTNQQIQQALKGAGLYDGPVDGKIGPKTKKAIRKFQIQNHMTVDGKVGKKTWAKMSTYLSNAAMPAETSTATSAAATPASSTENAY